MMDWINHHLASVLTTEWAVPTIVGAMVVGCLVILGWNYARHYRGMTRALQNRLKALAPVIEAARIEEAQTRFHDHLDDIETAMRASDGRKALVHAWLEYSETIVDTENP